jgi:hypothetical protein
MRLSQPRFRRRSSRKTLGGPSLWHEKESRSVPPWSPRADPDLLRRRRRVSGQRRDVGRTPPRRRYRALRGQARRSGPNLRCESAGSATGMSHPRDANSRQVARCSLQRDLQSQWQRDRDLYYSKTVSDGFCLVRRSWLLGVALKPRSFGAPHPRNCLCVDDNQVGVSRRRPRAP